MKKCDYYISSDRSLTTEDHQFLCGNFSPNTVDDFTF